MKMPDKEIWVIVVLFLALLAWGPLYQKHIAPKPVPVPPKPALTETPSPAAGEEAERPAPAEPPALTAAPPEAAPAVETNAPEAEVRPLEPEQRVTVSNGLLAVTISSWGGGMVSATLGRFTETQTPDSRPVVLDFSEMPALTLTGVPGLSLHNDFTVTAGENGASATIRGRTSAGLLLTRTVSLGAGYEITVRDVFSNESAAAVVIPEHSVQTGPMQPEAYQPVTAASAYLGIDVLPSGGGEETRHWAKKGFLSKALALPDLFQEEERRGGGCAMNKPRMRHPLPAAIQERIRTEVDWVCVKNRFFVQILTADPHAAGYTLFASRQLGNEKAEDSRTWASVPLIKDVSVAAGFPERRIEPGTAFARQIKYYVGPKEYSAIRRLGNHRQDVMEFGMLDSVCAGLLWSLNALHRLIRSYGIAIILLTGIIRVIFWPVTHKSTESMKKMQALQPEINALREKYKDKPQKLQQEMMALYKAHKYNPLSGCLPTVVQIPVFIALFMVLRSAVELRFARFLWIRDLSEPEGLLAGLLPIPINILPVFMAATMAWQQKLTPSPGDPAQQKMMLWIMPIMMLVLFYSMPSALLLYWSANQCMMIVQLMWHRKRTATSPAASG
jgi:YidC/Oxa1 family membrane protein insertase